ncbi:MAG: hypothetical protein JRI23_02860 [Deltaproteobacteria bacterium]|jgi:hypothetical protein|nr:hypothetical protein [Deltaproteobacteria bacterium]MBW2530446.1 hypothetical protein [Deltaproteobacteria bacterium]
MKNTNRNAVILLGLSLALFNLYRLIHLVPGDLLRSILVLAATVLGVVCLGLGVFLLYGGRRR